MPKPGTMSVVYRSGKQGHIQIADIDSDVYMLPGEGILRIRARDGKHQFLIPVDSIEFIDLTLEEEGEEHV